MIDLSHKCRLEMWITRSHGCDHGCRYFWFCVRLSICSKGTIARTSSIVKKSGGLGGTWRDNKYPGCCCDGKSLLLPHQPHLILSKSVTDISHSLVSSV